MLHSSNLLAVLFVCFVCLDLLQFVYFHFQEICSVFLVFLLFSLSNSLSLSLSFVSFFIVKLNNAVGPKNVESYGG